MVGWCDMRSITIGNTPVTGITDIEKKAAIKLEEVYKKYNDDVLTFGRCLHLARVVIKLLREEGWLSDEEIRREIDTNIMMKEMGCYDGR
jgi:hypothetical protein